MSAPTRTPEEVAALKRDWGSDPCWDIEDSEGFEAHAEELRAYRLEREAQWEREFRARVERKARELDCSPTLALYILGLEDRLRKLEEGAGA